MAQQDAPDEPVPTEADQSLIDAIRAGDEGRVEAALRDGASANATTTAEEGEFDNMSAGTLSALMLAYPTTLLMNVPYALIMGSTNEAIRESLNPSGGHSLASTALDVAAHSPSTAA